MDVGDWVGISGLAIAIGTIAINIGVTKAKIAGSERRITELEKIRDRMGKQVHKHDGDLRVLAASVNERLPKRSKTLTRIVSGEHETVEGDEGGEGEPPSEPT